MKNELVEKIPNAPSEYVGSNLPLLQSDFDALKDQRRMLMEFVSGQLRKDVDYGIIPGVKKNSLYKPGAEKLLRLFGLGVRFERISETLDRRDNFAMYTYKAVVFHMKSGVTIAECEGTCNSQEVKYKERTKWVNREPVKEPTPVCDIMNTLSKMSQKRAMVGAVILATGASDFFTQDIDDPEDAGATGAAATETKPESKSPNVTKVSTKPQENNQSQAGNPDGPPSCTLCGTAMKVSKAGTSLYCPNFNDKTKGEHPTIKIGAK